MGGQFARFCTTYDGAIYALVLALQSKEEQPPTFPCERIGKKHLKIYKNDETGLRLARLSLISVGEKIRDDRIDDGDLKSAIVFAAFSDVINKAKQAEPLMAQESFEAINRINALQDSGAPLCDVLAAYGDMAVTSFSHFLDLTPQTEKFIRSISEWNFLVDMTVDYADDYRDGTYNGLKSEGLPTFAAYFDVHYREFLPIAAAANDRLLAALMAVRDDSTVWNTLFKIIIHAIDTVFPSVIEGKDVEFHYFSDLFKRIGENRQFDRDIKRLGIEKHEKN